MATDHLCLLWSECYAASLCSMYSWEFAWMHVYGGASCGASGGDDGNGRVVTAVAMVSADGLTAAAAR